MIYYYHGVNYSDLKKKRLSPRNAYNHEYILCLSIIRMFIKYNLNLTTTWGRIPSKGRRQYRGFRLMTEGDYMYAFLHDKKLNKIVAYRCNRIRNASSYIRHDVKLKKANKYVSRRKIISLARNKRLHSLWVT